MRRLTPEEEKIVETIANSEKINITELLSSFLTSGFSFEVVKEKDNYIIKAWYNSEILLENYSDEEEETMSTIGFAITETNYRKLAAVLELILLLEKNDLILFLPSLNTIDSNSWDRYFIGEELQYEREVLKDYPKTYKLDGKGKEVKYSGRIYRTSFLGKVLHRLYVNDIFSTSALKIYAANEYRTEEQKVADDEKADRKLTNKHTFWALIAAYAGVALTGIFSAATLFYTCSHEKERDTIEDSRYKKDSISDEKKAKLDEHFNNKVMFQVDKATDNLDTLTVHLKKLSKPVPVEAKK